MTAKDGRFASGLAQTPVRRLLVYVLDWLVCALGRRPSAKREGVVAAQPQRQLKAAACL